MDQRALCINRRSSSCERLVAIGLTLLAVVSPLYIDRRTSADTELDDEQPINLSSYLPLLLLILIMAIAISQCLDQGCIRYGPNSIHRVGGSSGGLVIVLLVLALVLKFKSL